MMYLDILVLLVVVALIFQRLWKVLGTRPEEEPRQIKLSKEGAEKLCDLLRSEVEKRSAPQTEAKETENVADMSELDITLSKIPGFNKDGFINSAKKAFQIITEAFNKADTETLKMLVDKNIFKKLIEVIKERKENEVAAETDFICFDKAEIVKAIIDDKNNANLSVEFVSEQVNVLRNKDGEVIQGDENYIQTITDVWTFTKPLDTKINNWLLVSTKK